MRSLCTGGGETKVQGWVLAIGGVPAPSHRHLSTCQTLPQATCAARRSLLLWNYLCANKHLISVARGETLKVKIVCVVSIEITFPNLMQGINYHSFTMIFNTNFTQLLLAEVTEEGWSGEPPPPWRGRLTRLTGWARPGRSPRGHGWLINTSFKTSCSLSKT